MKKRVRHIVYSWALLLSFVTGQYMVFAHQHNIVKKTHSHVALDDHNTARQSVTEKCSICDSMHHTHMELLSEAIFHHAKSADRTYIQNRYEFKSIGLILSSGRAPPVVS